MSAPRLCLLHRSGDAAREAVIDSFFNLGGGSGRRQKRCGDTSGVLGGHRDESTAPAGFWRRQERQGGANGDVEGVIELWCLMGCWLGEKLRFPPFRVSSSFVVVVEIPPICCDSWEVW